MKTAKRQSILIIEPNTQSREDCYNFLLWSDRPYRQYREEKYNVGLDDRGAWVAEAKTAANRFDEALEVTQ